MNGSNISDQFLETELAELEIAAASFAQRFIPDSIVRKEYIRSNMELTDAYL